MITLSVRDRDARIAAGGLLGAAALWWTTPFHPPTFCPLRTATGVPCPFCGLTRACIAGVHGHVTQSLSYNPFGFVVLAAAAVMLVRPALIRRIRMPTWSFFAIIGVMWIWNLGFNPTFHQWLLR
jgi:hypothetical protein